MLFGFTGLNSLVWVLLTGVILCGGVTCTRELGITSSKVFYAGFTVIIESSLGPSCVFYFQIQFDFKDKSHSEKN
jgi:hypothetical protein